MAEEVLAEEVEVEGVDGVVVVVVDVDAAAEVVVEEVDEDELQLCEAVGGGLLSLDGSTLICTLIFSNKLLHLFCIYSIYFGGDSDSSAVGDSRVIRSLHSPS